jgi:hypothetical protein
MIGRALREVVLVGLLVLDAIIEIATGGPRAPRFVRPADRPTMNRRALAVGCLLGAFLWSVLALLVGYLVRWLNAD